MTWPEAFRDAIALICVAAVLIAIFGDPDWLNRNDD